MAIKRVKKAVDCRECSLNGTCPGLKDCPELAKSDAAKAKSKAYYVALIGNKEGYSIIEFRTEDEFKDYLKTQKNIRWAHLYMAADGRHVVSVFLPSR